MAHLVQEVCSGSPHKDGGAQHPEQHPPVAHVPRPKSDPLQPASASVHRALKQQMLVPLHGYGSLLWYPHHSFATLTLHAMHTHVHVESACVMYHAHEFLNCTDSGESSYGHGHLVSKSNQHCVVSSRMNSCTCFCVAHAQLQPLAHINALVSYTSSGGWHAEKQQSLT